MCCSVSVSESEVVGTTVLRLTATDADYTYDNTKLEYSIMSSRTSRTTTEQTAADDDDDDAVDDGMKCFTMTESSGDLILASALDRERSDRYELTVTVSDRGQPPLTTTTTVSTAHLALLFINLLLICLSR